MEIIEDRKVRDRFETLPRAYYLFGRDDELCDYPIEDRLASRLHFYLLHHKQGKWYLLDNDSTAGTFLNDKLIRPNEPYPLEDGDFVRAGKALKEHRFRLL